MASPDHTRPFVVFVNPRRTHYNFTHKPRLLIDFKNRKLLIITHLLLFFASDWPLLSHIIISRKKIHLAFNFGFSFILRFYLTQGLW